jgi:hypothetical protein
MLPGGTAHDGVCLILGQLEVVQLLLFLVLARWLVHDHPFAAPHDPSRLTISPRACLANRNAERPYATAASISGAYSPDLAALFIFARW